MGSMHVVEVLEGFQLAFQVRCGPEQHPIHTLSPQRADQPFDKRMGHGDIRHTLDFGHPQYPQVGVPLVKPAQRVMIGAEAGRTEWSSNRMAKHAAQGTTIHDAGMNTKANDPPGVVVHDHQHPMAAEQRGLAPEEVDAPQAVFRLPKGTSARKGHSSWVPGDSARRALGGPRPYRSGCRRPDRSVGRSADSPTWDCAALSRQWRPPGL